MVPDMRGTCLKCKKLDLRVVQARKDLYCHDCFIIFARSKYRRAIDAFRLELPPKQREVGMMIALSGGLSSAVLVDLVYTAILRTRGKQELPSILHIDDFKYTGQSNSDLIDTLKVKYPQMRFMERSLDEIDSYDAALSSITPSQGLPEEEQLAKQGMSLSECIASLSSRTSQEDMAALYRERLILETAREQGVQAILFGDSATALAAKTLSLTAKGRGYALPWETADHSLSHSGIWNIRPLKGLMHAELLTYSQLIGLKIPPQVIVREGKPNSIDHLTQRYFVGLEEQFPSLVATVVRTTNKLVEPLPRDQALGDCAICGMSYRHGARQWLRDITVSEAAPDDIISSEPNRSNASNGFPEEDLCYGCVVALRGSKDNLKWPSIPPNSRSEDQSRDNDKQTVLSEFELR